MVCRLLGQVAIRFKSFELLRQVTKSGFFTQNVFCERSDQLSCGGFTSLFLSLLRSQCRQIFVLIRRD